MAKSPFNIQDQYLNQARKERVLVDIAMMSGEKMQGYIKAGATDLSVPMTDHAKVPGRIRGRGLLFAHGDSFDRALALAIVRLAGIRWAGSGSPQSRP
ncbi:MAG: RNA chaperone Hfq [Desulfuromonadales bacterium]